jgi:hypothetical protein
MVSPQDEAGKALRAVGESDAKKALQAVEDLGNNALGILLIILDRR